MPNYNKYERNDISDISTAARHARNGDEVGLFGRRLVLCRLIANMRKVQIDCLYLYFSQGYSMEEIEKQLDCTVSTVSRNIEQAITKINEVFFCVNVTGENDEIFTPIRKRKEK